MESTDYIAILAALDRAQQCPGVTRAGLSVLISLIALSAPTIARGWQRLNVAALARHAQVAEETVRRAVRNLGDAGILDARNSRQGHHREVRLTPTTDASGAHARGGLAHESSHR